MTTAVFLVIAVLAGLGLVRTLRGQAASSRYLEEGEREAPLEVSHLTVPLQRVARETRALRLSLDEPLRLVRGAERLLGSDVSASEVERDLLNASRDIGTWVRLVERLSDLDKATMRDMGAHFEPVRDALAAEGWSLELRPSAKYVEMIEGGRVNMVRSHQKLSERLHRLMLELERIEEKLQIPLDPYR